MKPKVDWYGREPRVGLSRVVKRGFEREYSSRHKHWLRQRGRHDIVQASIDQAYWGFRSWSILDVPRKKFRARLLGRVKRRIEHEKRVAHSYAMHRAEAVLDGLQRTNDVTSKENK